MSENVLEVERSEGIVTLTLNRPNAMNALSHELRTRIVESFESMAAEPDLRAVILTGRGERAFCAGLDLKELAGEAPEGRAFDGPPADIVATIEAFDRPVIGAINGVAVTGGFELALACDVLVGSTNARFADTHARVGLMPLWGMSQKLSRLVGLHRAKAISLTGNFVSAEQAARWGLLCEVVEPEALLPRCLEIARDMAGCNPDVVKAYKHLIDAGFATSFAEGRRMETETGSAFARGVAPASIGAARRSVTERGRAKSRDR